MKTETVPEPRLRFPEFKGDWEVNRLGNISKISSGGTPSRGKYKYWGGTIPWVTTTLIDFNIIFNAQEFITEEGLANSSAKIYPSGTVLMAMYGQGKTRGKVSILGIDSSTNQACAAILPNNKILNELFLFQNLASRYDEIRDLSNQGGQQNLSGEIIKRIQIFYPSFTEQQKIASFLTSVDTKIQQLTQKKTLLEQYKKGVIQKVFNQEIRFKDENGMDFPEWEDKTLGELLNFEQPTKYIVSSTEYDNSYKTPVLTAGKTFILGYTDETEGIFKNNLPVIIFDDFTTATQFVNFPFKVKSSAMKILSAKNDFNITFIYEAMQSLDYVVGGHERHWISKYSHLSIHVPSKAEQDKIATFLSQINKKIELVNTQIEKTKEWKKGLLQQLFV